MLKKVVVILTMASLILSIVGLNKAKQLNGVGKGLSLAGLIISIVSILCSLVLVPIMMPRIISSVNNTWEQNINSTIYIQGNTTSYY